jgi:hypothetical protein
MRESFDVGNPDNVPDTWAKEDLLREFLGFFGDFYQVRISANRSILGL